MLSGNPITSLNNNSFDGVNEDLEMLDISNFRLHYFEYGCLDALPHLRSLKLTAYSHLEHFNIPHLLRHHHNIRELWIEAPQPFTRILKKGSGPTQEMQTVQMGMPTDLSREMDGHLPLKLTNITFSGPQFSSLNENILKVCCYFLYYFMKYYAFTFYYNRVCNHHIYIFSCLIPRYQNFRKISLRTWDVYVTFLLIYAIIIVCSRKYPILIPVQFPICPIVFF